MKLKTFALLATTALAAAFAGEAAVGQPTTGSVESHMAMAKVAAGDDNQRLYRALCEQPAAGPNTGGPPPDPQRSTWHVEPVKVFDNLYFVGEKEYSAWAVNTSDGIILIDTIWHYSVADEVEGGLRKLGLDPSRLKYAIVSHAHIDHIGGATYLQEKFGTRIILSEVDWQLAEATVTKHRPFGDHRTIARSAVNSPRRLPAPQSRMPRRSPTESAGAFCASVATYQRAARRTVSDSPTG